MFAIFTETADGRLNFAMEFAGELVDTGHIPAVKEHIEDVLVGLADNGVEVRLNYGDRITVTGQNYGDRCENP